MGGDCLESISVLYNVKKSVPGFTGGSSIFSIVLSPDIVGHLLPNLCLKETVDRGASAHGKAWAVLLETKTITFPVSEMLHRSCYTKIPLILLSNLAKVLPAAMVEMGSFWWKRNRRNIYITASLPMDCTSSLDSYLYVVLWGKHWKKLELLGVMATYLTS